MNAASSSPLFSSLLFSSHLSHSSLLPFVFFCFFVMHVSSTCTHRGFCSLFIIVSSTTLSLFLFSSSMASVAPAVDVDAVQPAVANGHSAIAPESNSNPNPNPNPAKDSSAPISESTHSCSRCSAQAKQLCPTCIELKLPPTRFCSQECFKAAWKEHNANVHKR